MKKIFLCNLLEIKILISGNSKYNDNSKSLTDLQAHVRRSENFYIDAILSLMVKLLLLADHHTSK